MKEYPSILYGARNITVYVFPKLDGSNIRVEWSRKKGFYKYGSRHHLIDETDHQLGQAVTLFKQTQEEILSKVLKDIGTQDAMVFCEFYGASSSHGNHKKDEEHWIPVIDIALDKKGIILPGDFWKLFKYCDADICLPIAHEKWSDQKTQEVRYGFYPEMTDEGVVCKANQFESPGRPVMFKVKSDAWLKKLKDLGRKEE